MRGKTSKTRALNLFIIVLFSIFVARFFVNITYYFPDGVGCWVYLSTIWTDNDLDIYNNLKRFPMTLPLAITDTGYFANLWNIGVCFVLSPFYLLAEFLRLEGIFGGRTSEYLLFTNFGSSIFGIFSCLLIYLALVYLGIKKSYAIISSICAFFGTPLFFYTYFLPQSAHPSAAFFIALFLTSWLITMKRWHSPFRYVLLGLLCGIIGAIRTELVMFALSIAIESFVRLFKERRILSMFKFSIYFLIFFLFGFSPQFLLWKFMYGKFITSPLSFTIGVENFALKDVLFSPFHGILFWTPIIFVGIIGAVVCVKRDLILGMTLFFSIVLKIIIISFLAAWWGGYSFAIRYFSHLVWPIGMSIGLALDELRRSILKVIFIVVAIGTSFWTLILALQAKIGNLDLYEPLNLEGFLRSVFVFPKDFFRIFFDIFKRDIGFDYPFFLLVTVAFVLTFALLWVYNKIKDGKFVVACYIICISILFFNYKLLNAHLNRSLKEMDKDEIIVPLDDLGRVYHIYDLEYRIRYFNLIRDKRMAKAMFERLRNLRPRTKYVQRILMERVKSLGLE